MEPTAVTQERGPRRRLSPEDRRQEIIAATIDTVAALGYRAATFAKIAERSGLSSTRLISYHFAGRDELMQATVAQVYGQLRSQVDDQVAAASGPRAQLAAYIRAVVGFVAEHRVAMQALASVFVGFRDEMGASRTYDSDADDSAIGAVEQILRRGQDDGSFRAFDPFVLGSLVQRSVDGLPFLLETRPGLDLCAYAEELVEAFDLATRRSAAGR
ncbi:TetR family transcriptional regulator [Amycolatopsis sp. NBC_00345]|uniref:TetR/AcrR family transcriptional regulator n=1 Tax=Amycolatopsis sp. NBC_00345 TaxID=2975955 RepID=UPI002E258ECB